jgi:hypothetical protein
MEESGAKIIREPDTDPVGQKHTDHCRIQKNIFWIDTKKDWK